jgi:hypothetical protein
MNPRERMGQLSEATRIRRYLKMMIELVADNKYLKEIPYKEIQPLENDLHDAYKVVNNIIVSLGESPNYDELPKRIKENKSKENQNEPVA